MTLSRAPTFGAWLGARPSSFRLTNWALGACDPPFRLMRGVGSRNFTPTRRQYKRGPVPMKEAGWVVSSHQTIVQSPPKKKPKSITPPPNRNPETRSRIISISCHPHPPRRWELVEKQDPAGATSQAEFDALAFFCLSPFSPYCNRFTYSREYIGGSYPS